MTRRKKKVNRRKGFTAYDLEPPVPLFMDLKVMTVIHGLRTGNLIPLADQIECGRLDYVSRFFTDEDNVRLARALRTGSSLTRAEKHRYRQQGIERDKILLTRIVYWRVRGKPLFSHTSQDTAVHLASNDYGKSPISGAPARSPESTYKHVWKAFKQAPGRPLEMAEHLIEALVQGLNDSNDQSLNKQQFQWFSENVMKPDSTLVVKASLKNKLAELLNSAPPDETCSALERISQITRRRTYLDKNKKPVDIKTLD
ncbi:hypothetical protein FWJ25_01715 [Marinobacter salinexigens]|uniref:Uncharacterized protein n=1 Tax=Marinobacter salinexigens TaxID=2919747 RepID=A0A5B0VMR1_9GAMM|nr:hypothetical protein [Marinobacter salinexigens]KAA1175877.1 hypothetical protein FWJ25_01715 [Marinobacter salinexigens]